MSAPNPGIAQAPLGAGGMPKSALIGADVANTNPNEDKRLRSESADPHKGPATGRGKGF